MNIQEQLAERIELFTHAVRGDKTPFRTPHFNNFWSWKITDAGYSLSQAIFDNDIMIDVIKQWLERYPGFDLIYETGHRNPLAVAKAVGVSEYKINDSTNTINIADQCFMSEDEYDEVIDNYVKFYWEKALPRRAKGLNISDPIPQLSSGISELRDFYATQGKIKKMIIEDYGMPTLSENSIGFNGIEWLFNYLRGIKGLSIDLRRRPEKVEAAADAISATTINRYENNPNTYKGHSKTSAFDYYICMLAHTILNPKQFERFFFPQMKYMGEIAEKYDKCMFIFQEGEGKRFWDMYHELPSNRFCLYSEMDDVYEIKKDLPNMSVGGGMPQVLLANGSPQACCDKAKMLIDDLGHDGKYIFGANKMMSFPDDCKRENLMAVCEFVHDYRA